MSMPAMSSTSSSRHAVDVVVDDVTYVVKNAKASGGGGDDGDGKAREGDIRVDGMTSTSVASLLVYLSIRIRTGRHTPVYVLSSRDTGCDLKRNASRDYSFL